MEHAEDLGLVPDGYSRVNAWVISADSDAEIRFLTEVFDARERPHSRVLTEDGRIGHVEVIVGDVALLMFDARPGWGDLPAHLRVYVDDARGAVARAVARGARVVTEPTELAFGERVARIRDPQGHLWWIHERIEAVDLPELQRRFADPDFQRNMTYVQDSLSGELASAARPAPSPPVGA